MSGVWNNDEGGRELSGVPSDWTSEGVLPSGSGSTIAAIHQLPYTRIL